MSSHSSVLNSPPSLSEKPQRTSWWPRVIIGSFLLLAAFDAGIVTLAVQSTTGEITNSPYEEGLKYEAVLEGKRAAKRDGLEFHTQVIDRRIEVSVDGLRVSENMDFVVKLLRPDRPALDMSEKLKHSGATFHYSSPALKNGLWLLSVEAKAESSEYNFGPEKIFVP